jgi:hypothetical protein
MRVVAAEEQPDDDDRHRLEVPGLAQVTCVQRFGTEVGNELAGYLLALVAPGVRDRQRPSVEAGRLHLPDAGVCLVEGLDDIAAWREVLGLLGEGLALPGDKREIADVHRVAAVDHRLAAERALGGARPLQGFRQTFTPHRQQDHLAELGCLAQRACARADSRGQLGGLLWCPAADQHVMTRQDPCSGQGFGHQAGPENSDLHCLSARRRSDKQNVKSP